MAIENRDNIGLIDGQNVFGMRIQGLAKAGIGNGVVASSITSTALKVTQRGAGADRSVDVQLGNCRINAVEYTEAAIVNLPISTAHATSKRIELIVYDQSAGNPAVVDGTPHATDPQVPDVTDDNDIPLGIVLVNPAVSVINTADIYDLRCFATVKYTMVGMIEFGLKTNVDNTEGSCFQNGTASYVSGGKLKIKLPTVIPSGAALTAKFFVIMRPVSASVAYAQLYNDTGAIQATTMLTENYNEPNMLVSASLTTGAGKNIINDNVYSIDIKNSAGVNTAIYRAWLEFYVS